MEKLFTFVHFVDKFGGRNLCLFDSAREKNLENKKRKYEKELHCRYSIAHRKLFKTSFFVIGRKPNNNNVSRNTVDYPEFHLEREI